MHFAETLLQTSSSIIPQFNLNFKNISAGSASQIAKYHNSSKTHLFKELENTVIFVNYSRTGWQHQTCPAWKTAFLQQ